MTELFSHTDAFTQTLLHTGSFTHTHTLLHTDSFTHRRFYTQALLRTGSSPHRHFYTLHFYTQMITDAKQLNRNESDILVSSSLGLTYFDIHEQVERVKCDVPLNVF